MSNSTSNFKMYNYNPSTGAAALFAVLFALTLIVLSVEVGILNRSTKRRISASMDSRLKCSESQDDGLTRKKVTSKYICLLVGCGMEMIGYIARAFSTKNQDRILPFIIQSVFVLISPALFAASIYMIFGAMLTLLECSSLSIVPARYNTTFFVCGDIFSFLLQCGGGGLMAKSGTQNVGKALAIVGLIIQLVFFGFFLITEVRFLILAPRRANLTSYFGNEWKIVNWTLIASSILIFIRCVVRTAEFCEGQDGYLMSNEWIIYVFDSLLIIIAVWVFAVSMPFASLYDVNNTKIALNEFKETSYENDNRC
ncbi:LAQU0S30e00254g1_1 [Lachancea quebecensis]|uniref:LAQU0S30e00254g1_1 n=1 Tax=Lachancea quebecensis TaxID=1654605 RepID=A0A0P1KYP5_9SACH|nr:LAQU0S30e00254g1_1 [Lachancea quebecensis]